MRKNFQPKKEFLDDLAVALGGYAVEEMVYNDISTGPSNDLQVATSLANAMVTRYGMSEVLGPVAFEGHARYGLADKEHSEDVRAKIGSEVKKLVTDALSRAREACEKNRKLLDAIASKLIEVETLEQEEFEKILIENGIKPREKRRDCG
jgi:cell division protease FtsH